MTPLHDTALRGFASDNYSGIHPEVLAAIATANDGHQVAYGEDEYTARLQEVFAHHFGEGVHQFWIRPDDLAARRFDLVELTASAY